MTMSVALLEDVWGEGTDDVPHVSGRVATVVQATEEELSETERLRLELMERSSRVLVVIMSLFAIMLLHLQNLRRELRSLRVGLLRHT